MQIRERKTKKRNRKKAYTPQKAVFGDGEDYYVYRMSASEKLVGGISGFLAGFFVSMVFFRDLWVSLVIGGFLIIPMIRKYRDMLRKKRMKNLLLQFRDLMESLTASYSAGKNTEGAFRDAYADMVDLYGEKTDIVHEIQLIVAGLYNGQNIDELLNNFARRSHLDDIESFATIFEVTNRYGGNLKKVVGDTRQIINDKIETELEIQTLLTANQNELNIMMVMPLLIMLMMNGMGSMSVVQNTPLNVVVKCCAIGLFALAYYMGRKIIDIKI